MPGYYAPWVSVLPYSNALRLTDRSMNYSCSPYTLPSQEVYEHILDFLWDDPITLARCCMVCRRFRSVALQHLTDFSDPTLCGTETLVQSAHALKAKQHWTFSKRTFCLDIHEDPRRPFVHLFPLLLPGCHVQGTTYLHIEGMDWSSRRLHNSFFDYLSY